jgi:hypothetical protein
MSHLSGLSTKVGTWLSVFRTRNAPWVDTSAASSNNYDGFDPKKDSELLHVLIRQNWLCDST